MPEESHEEQIARETKETEAAALVWKNRSDDYLVGYVTERRSQFHTPAMVEMDRRLVVAFRAFNVESGKQAGTMIRLTWAILVLTVVLGIIALLQLWAMLKGVA